MVKEVAGLGDFGLSDLGYCSASSRPLGAVMRFFSLLSWWHVCCSLLLLPFLSAVILDSHP